MRLQNQILLIVTLTVFTQLANAQDKLQILVPAHIPPQHAQRIHQIVEGALKSEYPNLSIETFSKNTILIDAGSSEMPEMIKPLLSLKDIPEARLPDLDRHYWELKESSKMALRESIFQGPINPRDMLLLLSEEMVERGVVSRLETIKLKNLDPRAFDNVPTITASGLETFNKETIRGFVEALAEVSPAASSRLIEVISKGLVFKYLSH